MKTWVLLLLGCMLVATSHAQSRREVYEWTDANGVKHYSDYPQPGARKITLTGAPTMGTVVPSASPTTNTSKQTGPSVQYTALEIISPQDDTSYFEPDDEITVRVRSEPAVDADDRLVTYLDGKQTGEIGATDLQLSGLERGSHTLQSVIFGRDGKEKISSARITIHMKQTTVANPRSQGTTVRPKPKPAPR